jgi:hypothetical protein
MANPEGWAKEFATAMARIPVAIDRAESNLRDIMRISFLRVSLIPGGAVIRCEADHAQSTRQSMHRQSIANLIGAQAA